MLFTISAALPKTRPGPDPTKTRPRPKIFSFFFTEKNRLKPGPNFARAVESTKTRPEANFFLHVSKLKKNFTGQIFFYCIFVYVYIRSNFFEKIYIYIFFRMIAHILCSYIHTHTRNKKKI